MEGGYYYVLTRGRWARAVPEQEFSLVRDLERDGWRVIWDSARSEEAAYDYAAAFARCLRKDYMDSHGPRPMERAIPLFRSVSLPELEDICIQGVVNGKGNVFNEFDDRRFVFFGNRISRGLIFQGEDLERQAMAALDKEPAFLQFMEMDKRRKKALSGFSQVCGSLVAAGSPVRPGVDLERLMNSLNGGSAWAAGQVANAFVETDALLRKFHREIVEIDAKMAELRALYAVAEKDWISREKEVRPHRPFTSAVIETAPLGHGFHYSKAHGKSGMGDEDEYGFHRGSVSVDDLVKIHLIRDGKTVRIVPVSELEAVVEEARESPGAAVSLAVP